MKLDDVQQRAREQFGRQSARYGKGHILADVSDVVAALEHMELPPGARVLDVACGAGHTGLHFASLGCEVTLSDLAEPMLDRVREAAAERGLTVTTRHHVAEELPYADRSFDVVSSRVAPHHFTSPGDFVRESARVLRPGGWFLLIDGSVPDCDPVAEEWLHRVEKLRDPSHHRLGSRSVWSRLCEEQGLTVRYAELHPFLQPDLEWCFETAATAPENRVAVRRLVTEAPEEARAAYRIETDAEGKITWWWPRLTLVARK